MVATGALAPITAAGAAPPPGQDFNVTQGDLEYIIKQIDISEAHAEDVLSDPDSSPLCADGATFDTPSQTFFDADGDPCVGDPLLPHGLRTVDGRWNNLMPGQDGYGTAQETFPRLLEAEYQDADTVPGGIPGNPFGAPGTQTSYSQTNGFVFDSAPRTISNLIVDMTASNPAAREVAARVEGGGSAGVLAPSRLFGTTAADTSAAISASHFEPGVPTVFIARVDHYSDALVAGAAAKAAGGPVLLVNTDGIPAGTAAELERLAPQRIVVVGGPIAVNDTVVSQLGSYTSGLVTRVSGQTSYDTAVEISKFANPQDGPVDRVYVATGANFPDALAAAAPAARDGHQVLLVRPDEIPANVFAELQRLAPAEIVLLGGPLAVNQAVEDQLADAWPTRRVGGQTLYDTSALISADNFQPGVDTVYLATGQNFPDALSIAPVAGTKGSPILLVPRTGTMSASVQQELLRLAPRNVVIVGGPLAVAQTLDTTLGETAGGNNIYIPDIATDEGLSASATSLFVIFGQFFDHGLDLVSKGGNGTVVIPLNPDDPLYVPGGRTNFLTLTRATIDDTGGQREHVNRTTPFVDQNQTYGSHASHQAFMREYELDATGSPVPTGRILNGDNGGLPTWLDVKEQARDVLGIALDDFDVLDVPLLATDPYGHLVLGANGQAQLAFEDGLREGDRSNPLSTDGVLTANASFLDDIAHGATPAPGRPDPNGGPEIPGYDNAALEAHYITGDGRGNENIGLTSVHHVFHAEHNRVMAQIDEELATMPQALQDRYHADGFWDYGERLFQAARFFTEMQYQHLVFEEFARRIQPNIDATVQNENSYQPDVNSSIRAEFAHAVYRFGHSMLREEIPVQRANGTFEDVPLLDAFLNPREFAASGTTGEDAAGNILKGLANQTANGVDEFVTDTLRNKLLGLPLDLPAINMARARDTGTPGMQAAREVFFGETRDPQLAPYDNWEDFRLSMKNPESIGNFIAAYGNHPSVADATTLEAKRAAGEALAADAAFMQLPAAESGLDDVDLWMGGLAEKPFVFGGMLGTTFNHVFEKQLEDLQNGDRFYYLSRNLGNSLFHTLEGNSLSQLVLRNTTADRVPHDVFAAPQLTFNLDEPQTTLNAAGLTGSAAAGWRFNGGEHITIQDTDAASNIRGGIGDDSVWGKGGNDRIEGDDGADAIMGGDGDDILTDLFGDDRLQGEAGNDALNGGPGVGDLLFGGSGQDFIVGGQDASTVFAGLDDDFVVGSTGRDNIRGDEGDDWIDGGSNADLLVGDLSNTMQNDPALYHGGHDVTVGRTGNNDHDAEGGDDIMVGGPGTDRFSGQLGFDWVTYDSTGHAVRADMDAALILPGPVSAITDRYLDVEAVSGFDQDDVIRGTQNIDVLDDPLENSIGYGHRLTQEHLDRVEGLRDLLGGGETPAYAVPFLADGEFIPEDMNNNLLMGGGGSDLFEPRQGENYVDGDSWLDVNVVHAAADGTVERSDDVNAFTTRIFDRTINPSELSIERRIQTAEGGQDTVVYAETIDQFTITELADGVVEVRGVADPDNRVDYLRNIEQLQFADGTIDISGGVDAGAQVAEVAALTVAPDNAGVPADGDTLTATVEGEDIATDAAVSFELQVIALDTEGNEAAVTTQENESGEFGITEAEAGSPVQIVATVTEAGAAPTQFVSEPTAGEAKAPEPEQPTGP